MQETWVWSQGREDSLEKGMGTHSSILAWRIPRTGKPGGLWSMGLQRVGYNWVTDTFTFHTWFLYKVSFKLVRAWIRTSTFSCWIAFMDSWRVVWRSVLSEVSYKKRTEIYTLSVNHIRNRFRRSGFPTLLPLK